jgi:branched-chain amino acid transport system permease protein
VGGALELGMFRPLRRRKLGAFQFVALTIGLSLLARHLILIWYGPQPQPYRDYVIQDEWEFGPFALTPRDATIMIISAIILALVGLMLTHTRMGKAMRAVSDSVDLAESSGIDVNRVTLSVWVVGAGLAALGGVFMGAVEAVDWQMGFRLLLLLFAAVVLGGLGTAFGAVVGGIVIGVITETSTVWVQPEIKSVFALIALILVLLVRPQGILGVRGRIG